MEENRIEDEKLKRIIDETFKDFTLDEILGIDDLGDGLFKITAEPYVLVTGYKGKEEYIKSFFGNGRK